jgi:hypothetical protein
MQRLLASVLAVGLAATAVTPSFAACAGHTAENKDKPVTTADTGTATTPPPATDRQG